MIALNRRIMTYKQGCHYVDIVTKEDMYEAWIYNEDSDKYFMFGMPKDQQSYFDFFEIVEANIDDYTYMCDTKGETE